MSFASRAYPNPPGSSNWTPANLAYTKAWYVSDNPSNVLTSGELSSWADKGGGVGAATPKLADVNNRALLTNTLNGRSVVHIDTNVNPKGSLRAGTNSLMNNISGLVVFSLSRRTGNFGVTGDILHIDYGNGYNTKLSLLHGDNNTMRVGGRRVNSDGYFEFNGATIVPNSTWVMTTGVYNYTTGAVSVYVDGNLDGTGTMPTTGNTQAADSLWLSLGFYSDNNNTANFDQMTGDIAEVLVVPVGLTTDERQRCEGYIAWSWGRQLTLPVGHPYRAAAPTF